jgi:hypothetical protein
MFFALPVFKTSEALWQNGQRKLQPQVNTVAAIFSG